MRDGKCPRCGYDDICVKTDGLISWNGRPIVFDGSPSLVPDPTARAGSNPDPHPVTAYICKSCGYMESYLEGDLTRLKSGEDKIEQRTRDREDGEEFEIPSNEENSEPSWRKNKRRGLFG